MAEFEQTENVEIQGGEPPVKSLYNTLKNDKEYGHIFSTYTPEEFESNLKSNKEAATSLKQIAIQKGIYKTDKDFDVAIFGSKPQAPAKAPAETKQPKEEKGWIRSAVTDGVPGLLAKFASSPVGQSLGRTVGQTKEITGEPVKKKKLPLVSFMEKGLRLMITSRFSKSILILIKSIKTFFRNPRDRKEEG